MFGLKAIVLAALSSTALASLFTTAPVAGTTWQAGQSQTVKWEESPDNAAPTLLQMKNCQIGIWVGSQQQQTQLQSISASTDVSTINQISFTPNASIGPDGPFYFIRFTSLSATDPANAAQPAEAFSAKFALSGMTGQFSPAVSSLIAGASVTFTTPGATPSTSTAIVTVAKNSATTTPPSSRTSTSTAKPTTTSKSGASPSAHFSGLVMTLAALLGFAIL